jgi:predicted  nucleic acid-binding Zn-ribbon protein
VSKAREYYHLQKLDSAIEAKSARLVAVEAALDRRDAVDAIKAAFEEAQATLNQARSRQRDRERELEDAKRKLAGLEKTMYGGSVANPKALDEMRQEAENTRKRLRELQDAILDTMIDVEECTDRAGTQQEVWEGAEQAWADEQAALRTERKTIQGELADLRTERESQAGRLVDAGLAKYERLRATKGGAAVAILQGTVCTGCRLALSSGEAQKVRVDAMVNFCPHCGRILVYGVSA